jgi:hypothetical protein
MSSRFQFNSLQFYLKNCLCLFFSSCMVSLCGPEVIQFTLLKSRGILHNFFLLIVTVPQANIYFV